MAKLLGWNYHLIDGRASVSRRAEAQAIALQPDGIVLGTIDANEQAAVIEAAAAEGSVVVGWHATAFSERTNRRPFSPTSRPTRSRRRAAGCVRGYVAPARLLFSSNIEFDGGPNNI
jgi:ribose transport system substrate-binding protein